MLGQSLSIEIVWELMKYLALYYPKSLRQLGFK
jgi:hypothetical protein